MPRLILFALSLLAGATATVALLPASAQQPVAACPERLVGTPSLVCSCSAEATQTGSVWGSDLYTDDSAICRAALHAGLVEASGGTIWVFERPGAQSYPAVARNGVSSTTWTGGWRRSIAFRPASEATAVTAETAIAACPPSASGLALGATLSCACTIEAMASGSVWGDGPYTGDSGICRSALHAGAVNAYGGNIRLRIAPGRAAYPAATRNGVEGTAWQSYATSLTFER